MPEFFPWPWPYPYSPGARWEIEPQGLYANASMRFVKLLSDFPAGYWTLQYGLVPDAGTLSGPIRFQSTPLNGSDWHLIDVEPPATAQWLAGKYSWQCFAQINSAGAAALGLPTTSRVFISKGTIRVYADLTAAGAVDTRGKWQRILDEIEDMILATAGNTQQEISMGRGTIAGQTIKGWTRQDLVHFRDYAAELAENESRIKAVQGGAPNPRFKYAVMGGNWQCMAANGFPDALPFS